MKRLLPVIIGALGVAGIVATTLADSEGGEPTVSGCCFQMGAFCEETTLSGGRYSAKSCRSAGGIAYADDSAQCDVFCGAPPNMPPRSGGGIPGSGIPPIPGPGAGGNPLPPLNPPGGADAGTGGIPTPPPGGGTDAGSGGGEVEQVWCCQGVQWFESEVLGCVQNGGIIFTGTQPPPPPKEWRCGLPAVGPREPSQCDLCDDDIYTPCTPQRCAQMQGSTPCRYQAGPPARCVAG